MGAPEFWAAAEAILRVHHSLATRWRGIDMDPEFNIQCRMEQIISGFFFVHIYIYIYIFQWSLVDRNDHITIWLFNIAME